MKKGRVLILVLVLVLFPIISFAADYDKPKTGYDLYQDLMGLDPNNSAQQRINALYSVGYLDGFLDSLRFMEDMYYESFFPSKTLSEEERRVLAKKLDFRRLNLPQRGIAVGQFILVFKKYAEKNPGRLSASPRICLYESLVEEFGWK